jgi:proline iminopeptidase
MVLCHGGPGLSDNLGPLACLADPRATVHRYDQRGAPRSTGTGPFDVATAVADLEHLRRFWGHDRWVVGGHSWGANLALLYALAHPERTAGVVYLSGLGTTWGWQAQTRRHRMSRLSSDERRELVGLEARAAVGDDAALPRMLRLLWSTDFASRDAADRVLDDGPLYRAPRNDALAAELSRSHRAALDAGIDEAVAALQAPVLCLHGAADADPSRSRRVADLAPAGRWALIPDAGHSPWLEQPALVGSELVAFIDAIY